jgi:hypothetical protein
MEGLVNGMSLSGQRRPSMLVAGNRLNGNFLNFVVQAVVKLLSKGLFFSDVITKFVKNISVLSHRPWKEITPHVGQRSVGAVGFFGFFFFGGGWGV